MSTSNPNVIVALDYPSAELAQALVRRLDPHECAVKVGKELFVSAGPQIVQWLVERKFNVFLDLKFHDIPNTVANACAAATRLGVWMLNIHASGGRAMMRAARDAVAATANETKRPRPLLLAVTVLTSLTDDELREIGYASGAATEALALAKLTRDCGLDGVVCSAQEAPAVRAACGPAFKLVTPGIRLPGSAKDDQSRIVTPEAAIRAGSDYLVIGRPITHAADPLATLAAINAGLAAVARSAA